MMNGDRGGKVILDEYSMLSRKQLLFIIHHSAFIIPLPPASVFLSSL
jgi:hypothetical protein